MVKWSPLESPVAKTLGACDPSGFGLGIFLRTPFTMIPPRLFHRLSHCTGTCTQSTTIRWLQCIVHCNGTCIQCTGTSGYTELYTVLGPVVSVLGPVTTW